MAKVGYSKFKLQSYKEDIKTIIIDDIEIEVKQYLPIEEKLQLIGEVISDSVDQNNFVNSLKQKVYFVVKVIEYYTNITFTAKQKENFAKLYDGIWYNKIYQQIEENIPEDEMKELKDGLKEISKNFYKYQTSALGIMDNIGKDYSNLNLEASDIQEKLADPNNLGLLKDVLEKLG